MNFGKIVKKEILDKPPKDRCCKKAFLAGIFRGAGKLYDIDGQIILEVGVVGEQAETLVRTILFSLYGYEVRTFKTRTATASDEPKTVLTLDGDSVYEILIDLEVFKDEDGELSVNGAGYGNLTKKPCCLRSFIRGLFLAGGSCTAPSEKNSKNTRYHLELNFSSSEMAEKTARALFENGVSVRIMRRKSNFVVYIKSVEEINNFFAFISAPVSVLKLTELQAINEFKNNANRQTNCEIANIDRQMVASEKYIRAIKKIDENEGIESLKKDLRETAKLKLAHPEYTLVELAEKLGESKSCINHRLRKLAEIADRI